MKRALLLAAVLLALGASEAQAHTTITCEPCSYPYQRWVDEAKVPTPDLTIAVTEAPCPTREEDAVACTESARIWMNPGLLRSSRDWPREAFYHELGHAFDYYDLTVSARARFRSLRHSRLPWEGGEGLGEQFAESYMSCAFDLPRYFADTQAEYSARTCHLIAQAANRGEPPRASVP